MPVPPPRMLNTCAAAQRGVGSGTRMAIQFHIEEQYRGALASLGLTSFEQVMAARMGSPVSMGKDRSTVRLAVEIAGQPRELYLKRTFRHPPRMLLRQWLTGRKPQAAPTREYRLAARLAGLGIRTARAVGWGQRTGWLGPAAAFVLFEAVPAAFSLDEVFAVRPGVPPLATVRERARILASVADVVRRLHEAGLRWPDLAAKHVLVALGVAGIPGPLAQGRGSDRPELWLVGLSRMHASGAARLRVRDLVGLLRSMPADGLTRTDLLRFALAYGGLAEQPWKHQKEALARDWSWAARLWSRLQRRQVALAGLAGYQPGRYLKLGSIQVDERYLALLAGRGVTTFDAVFKWRPADGSAVSDNGSEVRFEVPGADGDPMILRLHRFDRPRLAEQARRVLRDRVTGSSAKRLWRKATTLHKAGVATALPVAYGEKMRGWWERRSFVLFREPQGICISDLARSDFSRATATARRAAVRRCGELLTRLHQARLGYGGHEDRGPILVETAPGEFEPCCPDPAALVACRPADRLQDVAALHAAAADCRLTRTDRLRFARAYLGTHAPKTAIRQFLNAVLSARPCRFPQHQG